MKNLMNGREIGGGSRRTHTRLAWGRLLLSAAAWMTGIGSIRAQEGILEITAFEVGPTQMVVEFRDPDGGAGSHRLEHTESLTAPVGWVTMEGVSFTSPRAGEFRGIMASPVGAVGFVRVLAVRPDGGEAASAAFQLGSLLAREGEGAGPRLVFSKPYMGILRYSYTGPGVSQSGEVRVAGLTEVTLPAPGVGDDEQVDGLRFVSLRLERVAGAALEVNTVSTVVTEDNDEVWRGLLGEEGGVEFSLAILRTGGGERVVLRGDSTSFFPPGEYGATAWEFTPRRFHARIPGMVVVERAPPFQGTITNELEIEAEAPEGAVAWPGPDLSGRYRWYTSVAGRPFLNVVETGEFHMKRQPAPAGATEVPLSNPQP